MYSALEVVKDRLSSYLSVLTLNNFGGIIGKMFNFETDKLFFNIRGFKARRFPQTNSGSLTTTAWGWWGLGVFDFVVRTT